jgi:uncharacterized protein (DUF736 family)
MTTIMKTNCSCSTTDRLTYCAEINTGWQKTGETSGTENVSLSFATPEFGCRKLFANLGRAAGSDDENLYVVIWKLRADVDT